MAEKSWRNCELVVYEENLENTAFWETLANEKVVTKWAWILHDKEEGVVHAHFELQLRTPLKTSTICNKFGVRENQIEKIKGTWADALDYLTHRNAPTKYQYDAKEVHSNFDWEAVAEGSTSNQRKKLEMLIEGITRAGARRGSAPLAVLLALVMALAFPARAFASVYNDPIVTWTSLQSCDVCGPNNEYDAALAIIERTNTKIQISEPMYVELSNEGTGGRFYQLAQSLKCAADETPGSGDFVLQSSVSAGVALYGADYVWWQHGITVNDDLITGALQDYETILNGGHLGGGGSSAGGDVATPMLFTPTMYIGTNKYFDTYGNTPLSASFTVPWTNGGTGTFSSRLTAMISKYQHVYILLWSNSASINDMWWRDEPTSFTMNIYGTDSVADVSDAGVFSFSGMHDEWQSTWYPTDNARYQNGSNTLRCTYNNTLTQNINYAVTFGPKSVMYLYGYGGGSGGGGGNNNWPGPTDEPEPGPPEPPREPDPIPRDPIDWPQPYNPTTPAPGPEPTPTTPVTNPTNTSPADYTPWLMAILAELRGIHTDMNAWLDAIFEGIVDYGAAICSHIDTASENVRSTLRFMTQWMDEQLDTSFYQLRHLLWECANYIADSLDYTFVGPDVNMPAYDDSSVLYWLKRIYYKLGSGNVNTRPVDPVGDHDNWWDWIVQLIKNLILDLGMMGADFLSDMGDVLSEVVQKFPFSIPWDIAAYLTAFSTQPVTPVIVITIPAMSGFLPQTQFTIDLHPYDDAMATVRAVETIVFAFWLMWKCPMLLDMMDTAKWGI